MSDSTFEFPWGIMTVLLADPDRITYLTVKQALAKAVGTVVDHVETGAEALEYLARQRANLLIVETELPDMDGAQLMRRLIARGNAPPIVFFSADSRRETRVNTLKDGAVDFLQKPCDQEELRLRALGAIHRNNRKAPRGPDSVEKPPLLQGSLEVLCLPDLLSVLSMARASGRLVVQTENNEGVLLMMNGEVISATYGRAVGTEAVYAMIGRPMMGGFSLTANSGASLALRDIDLSVNELLLEGARLQDERNIGERSPLVRRISSAGGSGSERPDGRIFGPIPTPVLTKRFRDQIADPFVLGELHLMTPESLARWTKQSSHAARLHVWLVADLARGIRALLELASPVSELVLATSMVQSAKILGISFLLRDGLELDVLLVDPRSVALFASELVRTPSFVIVSGAADTTGASYGALLQRMASLQTDCILVAPSDASIVDWSVRSDPKSRAPRVHRLAGDSEMDLRMLLLEGLDRWGTVQ
jgi:DNA-binding response OmpR family regulator